MSFCHCHAHSEGSILDGYTLVEHMPKVAHDNGDEAICLTDHGTLGQSLRFWKAGKEHGVKTIQGVETYVTPDLTIKDKDSPTWHLVLLAQNKTGLDNLFAMSKIGWTDGFYSKPRVDYKTLEQYSEGIIALSACMAGECPKAIAADDFGEASAVLHRYDSIFPGRFYVELQPGNSVNFNTHLANLADGMGLPTVVTVDSHYDLAENKSIEELLLTMQQVSGFKPKDREFAELMFDEGRKSPSLISRLAKLWPNRKLRYDKLELHLMTRDEVVSRMDKQGFDGNALADTTLEIAERCEQIEFETGKSYLPKLVKEQNSQEYLEELCWAGLKARGLNNKPEYIDRLNEELQTIKDKNFADYFLIVWDVVNEARNRNIYVGPGRGSATGSLISYSLKITARDPIKRKLLFFRFIDPSRPDWPDIDLDFEHTRRDEMKRYMEEKWGDKLSLCTYSEFRAKGLIASICKSLGMKETEIRACTKHFNTLDEYEVAQGTKAFRARYPEIISYARALEGHISQTGMHAAGVVVSDKPFHEIVPIESRVDPENKKLRVTVSGFNMGDAEEVGLIKMDFLGLSNLTVIHDCVDLIKERHDIDIDWEELETDDPDVLKMLDGANAVGVFQMESTAFRNLLKDMGVSDFNDMVASNALVRPGAFDTVAKDYIRRKKGLEAVTYPHEDAEPWLCDTYGLAIYQEQVMALSVVLGGFTWAEANKLRKIIGKKRDVAEFMPFFDKWMAGAGEKIGEKEAERLWHEFEKHAGYSFNLSHADAYSYIGYVTAWLKFHYPLEYIYAMLKSEKEATNKMTYLLESRRLGIEILPPDVNYSNRDMMVDENSLRFGLSDIMNCGYASANEIIKKRPFVNWDEWNDKITIKNCNAKVVESLVAVDAFHSVENAPYNSDPERNYLAYLNYPLALEFVSELGIHYDPIETYDEDTKKEFNVYCGVVKSIKRTDRYVRLEMEDSGGTMTCFGSMTNDLSKGELVLALVGEKTMLGYARVGGLKERMESNNLHGFEKLLVGKLFDDVSELHGHGMGGVGDEKSLIVPLSVRRITTKTSKKMAFIYITDGNEVLKLTVFPRDWEKVQDRFQEFKPLCVKLRVLDDGGWTVNAQDVISAYKVLESLRDRSESIKT